MRSTANGLTLVVCSFLQEDLIILEREPLLGDFQLNAIEPLRSERQEGLLMLVGLKEHPLELLKAVLLGNTKWDALGCSVEIRVVLHFEVVGLAGQKDRLLTLNSSVHS